MTHVRTLQLSVSAALFQLVTESIRAHSNDCGRLQTFDAMLADLLTSDADVATETGQLLKDHLTATTSSGPIAIDVRLSSRSERALDRWSLSLRALVESPLGPADIISALLFQFLVEHRVRLSLEAIGRSQKTGTCPTTPIDQSGNVVPIRRSTGEKKA